MALNKHELWWYQQLSAKASPDGYTYCTKCDSTRPTSLFPGNSALCRDCAPKSQDSGPTPRREYNRVVNGHKKCTWCNEVKPVATEYSVDRHGSVKSRCKKCYNQTRRSVTVRKAPIQQTPTTPTSRKIRNQVRELGLEEVPVLPVTPGLPCTWFDNSVSRRQRYLDNAPFEEFTATEVFERDGWVCQLCGEEILRETTDNRLKAAVDHIVPVVHPDFWRHGHVLANVQAAHTRCNSLKGNRV